MQKLEIEFENELDLTLLDNEFFVAMLNQIMLFKKCEVQYWDHGVCLSWYKYYFFRLQSINENSFLSRIKCIVPQPLTRKEK